MDLNDVLFKVINKCVVNTDVVVEGINQMFYWMKAHEVFWDKILEQIAHENNSILFQMS